MHQSIIIIDPKSEIRAKQEIDSYVIAPSLKNKREAIRIEDIQKLIQWSSKTSFAGGQKTIVIEQLHKSSPEVPHALLKLIEEPPAQTHIILTINQRDAILPTIASRCAILEHSSISTEQLQSWGLERVEEPTSASTHGTSWQEFCNQSRTERLQWAVSFLKSKKELSGQLNEWQLELSNHLSQSSPSEKLTALSQLALIEQELAALRSNVLPRLILHHFIIRL